MEGFLAVIDAVDGVTVTNPFFVCMDGETFEKGVRHLFRERAFITNAKKFSNRVTSVYFNKIIM